MENKVILLNGEKYVINFSTKTIYKNTTINNDGLLPVQATIGNYPFKIVMNNVYFYMNDKNQYFEVNYNSLESTMISKEKYDEISNLVSINKNNPMTRETIERVVTTILLEEVLKNKYALKNNLSINNSNFIARFSKNFDSRTIQDIKTIVESILAQMPLHINKNDLKSVILNFYKKDKLENEDFFEQIINKVHSSNLNQFDYVSNELKENIELRKNSEVRNETNLPNSETINENTDLVIDVTNQSNKKR